MYASCMCTCMRMDMHACVCVCVRVGGHACVHVCKLVPVHGHIVNVSCKCMYGTGRECERTR